MINWMAGDDIGVEGTKSLCEVLKVNTTLTWLLIWSQADGKITKQSE